MDEHDEAAERGLEGDLSEGPHGQVSGYGRGPRLRAALSEAGGLNAGLQEQYRQLEQKLPMEMRAELADLVSRFRSTRTVDPDLANPIKHELGVDNAHLVDDLIIEIGRSEPAPPADPREQTP